MELLLYLCQKMKSSNQPKILYVYRWDFSLNMAPFSRKMKSYNVSWRCNLNQESESYSFGLAKSKLKKLILSHHIEGINDTYSWILFCTFWKHQTSSGDKVSSSICLHWNHTTRTDGWLYYFIFWYRWRRSSIFIIY